MGLNFYRFYYNIFEIKRKSKRCLLMNFTFIIITYLKLRENQNPIPPPNAFSTIITYLKLRENQNIKHGENMSNNIITYLKLRENQNCER